MKPGSDLSELLLDQPRKTKARDKISIWTVKYEDNYICRRFIDIIIWSTCTVYCEKSSRLDYETAASDSQRTLCVSVYTPSILF